MFEVRRAFQLELLIKSPSALPFPQVPQSPSMGLFFIVLVPSLQSDPADGEAEPKRSDGGGVKGASPSREWKSRNTWKNRVTSRLSDWGTRRPEEQVEVDGRSPGVRRSGGQWGGGGEDGGSRVRRLSR